MPSAVDSTRESSSGTSPMYPRITRPFLLDFFDHSADEIDRNREPDALGTGVLGKDRSIDANELSIRIDQGATRIALIDCSIGLNEVFEGQQSQYAAACRTDDALCHCFGKAVRIAYGEHNVADPELVRTTERNGGKCAEVNFQEREVCFCINANQLRACNWPSASCSLISLARPMTWKLVTR